MPILSSFWLLLYDFLCGIQDADPVAAQIRESTEEGKKVSRNLGNKWEAVFRRVEDTFSGDEVTHTSS